MSLASNNEVRRRPAIDELERLLRDAFDDEQDEAAAIEHELDWFGDDEQD